MKGIHLRTSTAGGAGALRDKTGWFIYPFFGIHMLMFGLFGFLMAYSADRPDLTFLYMHCWERIGATSRGATCGRW